LEDRESIDEGIHGARPEFEHVECERQEEGFSMGLAAYLKDAEAVLVASKTRIVDSPCTNAKQVAVDLVAQFCW
jgi:hypothetical protein